MDGELVGAVGFHPAREGATAMELPESWTAAAANPQSGLFPGQPLRPVYREPHPVMAAPVLCGVGCALLWIGLFGGLAHTLVGYAWWTLVASVTSWIVALVLTRYGDRGVAVGIALAAGLGLSTAVALVGVRWITTYDWPLW